MANEPSVALSSGPIPTPGSQGRQEPRSGNSVAALCELARLHHIAGEPKALLHEMGLGASDQPTDDQLLLAAQSLGLKAKLVSSSVDRLFITPLPALARMTDGRWVVLAQCDGQRVLFLDPSSSSEDQTARPTIEPLAVFASQWSGKCVLATSRASLAGALAKFDFSWFIPRDGLKNAESSAH